MDDDQPITPDDEFDDPSVETDDSDDFDDSEHGEDDSRWSQRSSRLAGMVPFLCVLAAIVTIATSGLLWVTSPNWGAQGAHATAVRNVGQIPTATPPKTVGVAEVLIAPIRIEIPRLGATAPIINVSTLSDGSLDVPLNPKVVGWWDGGVQPGSKVGTAVLDGHINYAGVQGTLANIGQLNPGDDVYVYGFDKGRQKKLHFKITGVRTYDKHGLPYKQIFDQKSVGRLVIVTCGGPFDAQTGNYLDNIVAYAVLAP